MLTDQDISFIQQRGGDPETVQQQLTTFQEGFPYLPVSRPATPGDGIWQIPDAGIDAYVRAYERSLPHQDVKKFVPASGAATRMFKTLLSYLNACEGATAAQQRDSLAGHPDVRTFFDQLTSFAFYHDLKQVIEQQGTSLTQLIDQGDYARVLQYFLKPAGLGYENLPKGLLQFHAYGDHCRTAFEEQLVEGANYTSSGNETALHLTISPEHETLFRSHQQAVENRHAEAQGTRFHVTYSHQHPSTDTIAVDLNNEPFRDEQGYPLFRPGGHGALLDNLNAITADVIFIKNIDNVVPDRLKGATYRYKKLLGGLLLEYQERIFTYLKGLEEASISQAYLDEVKQFLKHELQILPPQDLAEQSFSEQVAYCRKKLDRPLRVCGMVKNEGEPGGGPFWVKDHDGAESLQIVEKDQIDRDDPEQRARLEKATHFNPVDIACATKNYRGEPFDLTKYQDPDTGFISEKSKDGQPLKALEHPGLWNGSMAHWNTLFVEVPVITFNPVKTILDLLRENHQAQLPQVVDR